MSWAFRNWEFRSFAGRLFIETPSKMRSPPSYGSNPHRIRPRVVLPQPDSPMRASALESGTLTLTPRNALTTSPGRRPPPRAAKVFVTLTASIIKVSREMTCYPMIATHVLQYRYFGIGDGWMVRAASPEDAALQGDGRQRGRQTR